MPAAQPARWMILDLAVNRNTKFNSGSFALDSNSVNTIGRALPIVMEVIEKLL